MHFLVCKWKVGCCPGFAMQMLELWKTNEQRKRKRKMNKKKMCVCVCVDQKCM